MTRNWKNRIVHTMFFLFLLLTACNNREDHAGHDTYTCPMHPTVISDKPGTCPVCGMDLVRKARPGEEVEITKALRDAIKSPDQSVLSAVKTITPEYKSLSVSVKGVGIVTYDTRRLYTVPARVGGRIEKLHVKYEFQPVRKGQRIAEIYSPELVTAQRELLYLLEHDPENTLLLEGAKTRLMRLGLSVPDLQELVRRKETQSTFAVYSPYDGYAITGNSNPPAVSNGKRAMITMGTPDGASRQTVSAPSASGLAVREGNYVAAGQTLISLVNTRDIRIELDLSQEETGMVKEGDKIEIDLGNGVKKRAAIDFVQPFFDAGQNFLKVRVNVNDHQNLHIGQLVKTNVEMNSPETLWVPKRSVVDLGIDKVVFVNVRDTFKPTKVITGISSGQWVEIKSGLATSDKIASDAHYLVDSESFIKTEK